MNLTAVKFLSSRIKVFSCPGQQVKWNDFCFYYYLVAWWQFSIVGVAVPKLLERLYSTVQAQYLPNFPETLPRISTNRLIGATLVYLTQLSRSG